jgi:hypothetical protein
MARGGYRHPKVLPMPAMPYPSTLLAGHPMQYSFFPLNDKKMTSFPILPWSGFYRSSFFTQIIQYLVMRLFLFHYCLKMST